MSEDWIASRLTNGIGNRFFQIAAAIGAAEKTGRRVVLFLPQMSRYEHGNWKLFQKCVPDIEILETASEWNTAPDEVIPRVMGPKGMVLKGWFQDERYFPRLDNPLLPRYPGEKVIPTDRVAVFFRFGDYGILPHHQIDLRGYYMKAFNKFPKDTEYIFFSDTKEKLVEIQKECTAKGIRNVICGSKSIESEWKMAMMCRRGLIGANSTYSWWIGWMAWTMYERPSDYKAYFPDIWMKGKEKMNLFGFPFTQVIELDSICNNDSKLESFKY